MAEAMATVGTQRMWGKREERADRERFVFEYRVKAFRLALSIVNDRDLAEDITQESLLRAFRSWSKVEGNHEAWARKIVVRCAIDALSRRRPAGMLDESIVGDHVDDNPIAVAQTLAKLTPEQRAILALALAEGLSYVEMAETLGIPEGTVGSRLNSARAAFKKAWETP